MSKDPNSFHPSVLPSQHISLIIRLSPSMGHFRNEYSIRDIKEEKRKDRFSLNLFLGSKVSQNLPLKHPAGLSTNFMGQKYVCMCVCVCECLEDYKS